MSRLELGEIYHLELLLGPLVEDGVVLAHHAVEIPSRLDVEGVETFSESVIGLPIQ